MLDVQDLKLALDIPLDDTSKDLEFSKTLKRVQMLVREYTQNENLPDSLALDDIYLYLCLKRLNPDTKTSAGKSGENIGGVSFSFFHDLPEEMKVVLNNYRFKRSRIL